MGTKMLRVSGAKIISEVLVQYYFLIFFSMAYAFMIARK